VEGFLAEGGEYKQLAVMPHDLESGIRDGLMFKGLTLSDGSKLIADHYVFACGPWLGKLFPETIGDHIRPTSQDVFFFGTPAGDDRFSESRLPVWADHRDRFVYGIPATDGRGFKVADDTRGIEFDPTSDERVVSEDGLKKIRDYVAFRFPAMKDAPLVETRVCQYENTPDNHLIIDRHPAADHVWLVGGGSGHGFKHGPALGEMVAELVIDGGDPDPLFGLQRFA
jgi:glycine/D-amino acid oxidase-like deaminating enzyme